MSQAALDHRHASDRLRAVQRATRHLAPGVFEALAAQEAQRPGSSARKKNLAMLGKGEASVVVTGQQAGLFTGPLYTIYKTAAAIKAAQALSEETGRPVVPVFWLQTEDHDWPEIDHCYVPSRETDGPLKISVDDVWQDRPAGDRVSVYQRPLGQSVLAALDRLSDELGTLPGAAEVESLLREHYRPEHSPGLALGRVVASIFADSGLLVLDAGDPALAQAAAPVHRVALENATAISEALQARGRELEREDRPVPVYVRPHAPLSFYHPEGADGPRFRLKHAEDSNHWRLCDSGDEPLVSKAEVMAALDNDPGRFSTSALLRPILQDVWLPTVAYFGGPGELLYLAQVRPLYPMFDRREPLIVPRARFRIADRGTRRKLDALGLGADEDLTAPRETLLTEVGSATAGSKADPEALGARWTQTVAAMFAEFAEETRDLDPGLDKAAVRARDTVESQLTKLIDRYCRTLAQRNEVAIARLDSVVDMLAPLGAPQERIYGWPWFAARFGVAAMTAAVLDACVPFDGSLRDIDPEAASEHH